ncbi:hypothetical protein PCA20602_02735 [Pandoraea capi]|uniref:Uncharacterized protein n=1 Tax=Pandoraea capi TaxID=2508286 RepID=A0ABY6W0X9_9BURK|nr:hypothetical protein [Pandoraea capi]VVE13018.1 hypothetical protein PCA20602_02735 [Pandoraea capi]
MEKDRIDWIEKAAVENFKAHQSATEAIEKQCTTTLTVFFAGIGGGLAYGAKALELHHWTWLSIGTLTFTAYIVVLAGLLICGCMTIGEYPQLHNEPGNLLNVPSQYSFEQIRVFELENMQSRIQQAIDRNAKVADRLNWIRLAAIASPLIFIASAACSAALGA